MLQLTLIEDGTILVAPERIVMILEVDGETTVDLSDEQRLGVRESASDVARLRAAWERRYTASKIVDNGDLPVLVYMAGEGDTRAIRFMCCALTAKLNQQARADLPRSPAGDVDTFALPVETSSV